MNRRNLLTRGIIGAMTIALPLVPAGAQQRLDVSRKAVTDDPVAPQTCRLRLRHHDRRVLRL